MYEEHGVEEISLLQILEAVKKGIGIIIFLILSGAIIAGVATVSLEKVEYQTKSTVVIGKEEARLFYEDRYTQGDIAMYEKTANTYIEIAKSDRVISQVADQYSQYSKEQIRSMITPTYKSGTLIIEIVGKGGNRKDVLDITNTYCNVFIATCTEVLPVGEIMIIDEAKLPEGRVPSKCLLNMIIGCMLGGVIAMLLILFKMFKEGEKIQTRDEMTALLQLPVATVIE